MLDIYIYENCEKYLGAIKKICFDYLFKENIESEIICAESRYETAKIRISECELQSVFILPCKSDSMSLCEMVKNKNESNYLVLSVTDISEILLLLKPSLKPSGFILKPPEKENIEKLLSEIYSDFSNSEEKSEDNFRFKIKAREYSIPIISILYFESRNKKIYIRTASKEYSFYSTFDEISKSCTEDFLRVHKSFMVNTTHIKMIDYSAMEIILDDDSVVYFSRGYKAILKDYFNDKGVI